MVRSILVGNLPRSVDRALLNDLFEGHVSRAAWSSTGQFCLVDLNDDTYTNKVIAARETFEIAKQDAAVAQALAPMARLIQTPKPAGEEGQEDATPSPKKTRKPRKVAPPVEEDVDADGAAENAPVCEATDVTFLRFVRRIIVDSNELFIQGCVGPLLNQVVSIERQLQSERRPENRATAATTDNEQGEAVEVESPKKKDNNKKAETPVKQSRKREREPAAATATATTSTPKESEANVATKTNNVVAPPSVPAPAPVAAAPSFQRTSKDQCKFCGSEEHLSRHCPSR